MSRRRRRRCAARWIADRPLLAEQTAFLSPTSRFRCPTPRLLPSYAAFSRSDAPMSHLFARRPVLTVSELNRARARAAREPVRDALGRGRALEREEGALGPLVLLPQGRRARRSTAPCSARARSSSTSGPRTASRSRCARASRSTSRAAATSSSSRRCARRAWARCTKPSRSSRRSSSAEGLFEAGAQARAAGLPARDRHRHLARGRGAARRAHHARAARADDAR